MHNVKHLQLA